MEEKHEMSIYESDLSDHSNTSPHVTLNIQMMPKNDHTLPTGVSVR